MAKDKVITGAAGAYYVAFQLSAQGYAVGLTTYGTKAIDLFVAKPDTLKSITVQTKTMFKDASQPWGWKWQVGINVIHRLVSTSYFYAFVDLKGDLSQIPDVFIVPSRRLRNLLNPFPVGVDLDSPKVTSVWCNIQKDDAPKYKNRWDVIEDALA
jgi:hypothetical protein